MLEINKSTLYRIATSYFFLYRLFVIALERRHPWNFSCKIPGIIEIILCNFDWICIQHLVFQELLSIRIGNDFSSCLAEVCACPWFLVDRSELRRRIC